MRSRISPIYHECSIHLERGYADQPTLIVPAFPVDPTDPSEVVDAAATVIFINRPDRDTWRTAYRIARDLRTGDCSLIDASAAGGIEIYLGQGHKLIVSDVRVGPQVLTTEAFHRRRRLRD